MTSRFNPRERPILFSPKMVQAILAGKKTETRRVITSAFEPGSKCPYGQPGDLLWVRETCQIYGCYTLVEGKTKTGKQRWKFSPRGNRCVLYNGRFIKPPKDRESLGFYTRPSIFMPRWASRISLLNKGVNIERLADIDSDGAIAEGIEWIGMGWGDYRTGGEKQAFLSDPIDSYRTLWNSINAKPKLIKKPRCCYVSYPWDVSDSDKRQIINGYPHYVYPNPWVWVVKFPES